MDEFLQSQAEAEKVNRARLALTNYQVDLAYLNRLCERSGKKLLSVEPWYWFDEIPTSALAAPFTNYVLSDLQTPATLFTSAAPPLHSGIVTMFYGDIDLYAFQPGAAAAATFDGTRMGLTRIRRAAGGGYINALSGAEVWSVAGNPLPIVVGSADGPRAYAGLYTGFPVQNKKQLFTAAGFLIFLSGGGTIQLSLGIVFHGWKLDVERL